MYYIPTLKHTHALKSNWILSALIVCIYNFSTFVLHVLSFNNFSANAKVSWMSFCFLQSCFILQPLHHVWLQVVHWNAWTYARLKRVLQNVQEYRFARLGILWVASNGTPFECATAFDSCAAPHTGPEEESIKYFVLLGINEWVCTKVYIVAPDTVVQILQVVYNYYYANTASQVQN